MNHSKDTPKDSDECRLKPLRDFEFGEPVQLGPENEGEFLLKPMPTFNFDGHTEINPRVTGDFGLHPVTHKPYTGPMHLTPLNTGEDNPPLPEAEETASSDEDSNDDKPPMKGSVLGLD
jgi:hypothetical protein